MFLDIGSGILAALAASYLFNVEISIALIVLAMAFTLLPDVDFIYYILRKGRKRDRKYDHNHRNLMHFPLVYIPVGAVIAYLIGGELWAFLFIISSLAHFLHDSKGIGWGVKWLYPFSNKNYVFHYRHPEQPGKKRHLVFGFEEKELVALVEKYGDPDWMKKIYLTWRHILSFEFLFFAAVVIILLLVLYV